MKFNTIMVKILFNIYMEVIISRSEIDENPSIYSRYNPEKEQSAIFLGTFSRGGVGEIRGGVVRNFKNSLQKMHKNLQCNIQNLVPCDQISRFGTKIKDIEKSLENFERFNEISNKKNEIFKDLIKKFSTLRPNFRALGPKNQRF